MSSHPQDQDIQNQLGQVLEPLLQTLRLAHGKGFLQIVHKFCVNLLITTTLTGKRLDGFNPIDIFDNRRRQDTIGFHGFII